MLVGNTNIGVLVYTNTAMLLEENHINLQQITDGCGMKQQRVWNRNLMYPRPKELWKGKWNASVYKWQGNQNANANTSRKVVAVDGLLSEDCLHVRVAFCPLSFLKWNKSWKCGKHEVFFYHVRWTCKRVEKTWGSNTYSDTKNFED